MTFTLAPQLERDCHHMGIHGDTHILLNRNALFPWFILVPETTVTEIYQLEPEQHARLFELANRMSAFINTHFQIDKLNIASIGNIVSQMHIHIIGRSRNDPCWPGVVWGTSHNAAYASKDIQKIQDQLVSASICTPQIVH